MKTLCTFLLIAALPLPSQSPVPEGLSFCGTLFTVGLNQDVALNHARTRCRAEPRLKRPSPLNGMEVWDLFSSNKQSAPIGSITFNTKRALTNATKIWAPDASSPALAESFYFAVRGFLREGRSQCVIEEFQDDEIGWSNKEVVVRCGRKAIVVSTSRYGETSPQQQVKEELF